ncbi:nuclease-related domain-containing protein [Methylococcus sp. EFPC2]|uniref:nuclease-related domain-containing protein n=1 Tax=Methylococcus sp. EFPC2 TaxID=2812648 RepID=UPI0019684607|nr:nuclease-related domain-containing protein [Methylococcus sp. EFPC2]QSA97796.1 NERD domain-containing protein [Methylococcus sp. EFPC2]
MIAGFTVLLAGLEWWRYFHPAPFNPIVYSAFAILFVFYAAWQTWRTLPTLRKLRQASEGEKAVGQFLERLRENGYQVFHDVVGQGFNLDHVLIGPGGIFTVETKTLSKPARGEAKILFDGDKVTVAGCEPDRNPIIQAKSQAKWSSELLHMTGCELDRYCERTSRITEIIASGFSSGMPWPLSTHICLLPG